MAVVGILIHLIFLISIFDIYFKSPIVKNVSPYQPQHEPLADRLVLIVTDGLRAESFVNYTTMPYLRSVANSHGRWGISHTQVPTESRPGHIALIGGFHEDPSAVFKGWKDNPVDFDSVFNQSAHTWSWGTHDIVHIFTKSRSDDHIEVEASDLYDKTFSTDKNTTLLDKWVFDHVKLLFERSEYDEVVKKKLETKKVVFFLHLLGADTSGHTHKPKTKNFEITLAHVDEGVQEIEGIIRNHYGDDGRTTFLMTSDHGMTDWGSHGAGDDHETQTPYVIWGSGVKQITKNPINYDPSTNGMSLDHRFDVNQVDLTPLMSTILSIPVPVNSIGNLSTEVLDMSLSNRAKAIYSNCRQLASQYNKNRLNIEENVIPMLYKPYEPFSNEKYTELIELTEKLLREEQYEELINLSQEIIQLSLSGLKYYHNYYQNTLLALVTLSFLGWIACLLKGLSSNTQGDSTNLKDKSLSSIHSLPGKCISALSIFLGSISFYVVYAQNLPLHYFLYFLLPILLWWYALSPLSLWVQGFNQIRKNKKICSVLFQVFNYILGCVAMSLSFAHRWMLSVPLLGMAVWPFFSSTRQRLPTLILVAWPVGCVMLSMFSFMPVVGKEVFIELVIAAGTIWLVPIIIYTYKVLLPLYKYKKESKKELVLIALQTILLIISLQNIYVQSKRFERATPVSTTYQAMSWVTAVVSLILPLAFTKRLLGRLLAVHTSIITFYLLLSVSHEGLFIVALVLNITCWVFIEFRLLHVKNIKLVECSFESDNNDGLQGLSPLVRGINSQDFRRAFFYILYIILAFYGTGNIASLNSFEVRWVTCFITSFHPFVITTLILLKTLAPFLSVGCSFRAVQHITKAPSGCLNIIVLIYSNLMGIQLLYSVKNTGSWLEIGTSISQFVIVQVITVFIVLINQIAKFLTEVSLHTFTGKLFKSRKKHQVAS